MEEKGSKISYFVLFSWVLVVLFYFWCLGQIWSLKNNFGSTDTWEVADFAYKVAVIVFLLFLSCLFTGSYVIFIRWLNHNHFTLAGNATEESVEDEYFVDAERL